MAQNYTYPAVVSTSTNPSVGLNGAAIPTSSTLVAGKGPTSLETPISVDVNGNQNVNVLSSVLPTGAATEVTLAAMSLKLPASLGAKVSASSLSVVIASDQTVPISAASLPLPAGASTSALQTTGNTSIASIDTKTPSLGQAVMASSVPVAIASNQSAIPISAASLPLPSGAATETTLAAMSAKLPATLGAKTTANSLSVNIASDQTVPVSAASLPLPSGAATSALQTALNAQIPTTLGQKTSAASLAVVLASDQSSVPSKIAGKSAINKARNDYTSTAVTTGAYVQLIASTAAAISEIYIFDSSGQTLVLATGAVASEVDQIYITPGGNGVVPLSIAAGVRVSIKAVSATANVGEIDINFLG